MDAAMRVAPACQQVIGKLALDERPLVHLFEVGTMPDA